MSTQTSGPANSSVAGRFTSTVKREVASAWRRRSRLFAAAYLLAAVVAGLAMQQASQFLGAVQTAGRSTYTMGALTRPPLPYRDEDIVGAFDAWRLAAATTQENGTAVVDERLLNLIQSWVVWHARLDLVLFAPAVALILWWLLGRVYDDGGAAPGSPAARRRRRVRLLLPGVYLLFDLAETGVTLWLAHDVLEPGSQALEPGSWRTDLLLALTALKWLALLVTFVVIVVCALSRADGFSEVRSLARRLWVVRVQVLAVGLLGALIALPIAGPLDQIPDLLRSAHDESWFSTEVVYPVAILLGFSALIWSSGLLIVATIPHTDVEAPTPTSRKEWRRTRAAWLLLVVVLLVVALVLSRADGLRPSPGVWAAVVVAGVLLVLDAMVVWLRTKGMAVGAEPRGPRLTTDDVPWLEWTVVALAAAPLAIGGLGAVRAYVALVLLQSGDSSRTVHDGATAWFWVGVATAVFAPLVAVWGMRRLGSRLEAGGRKFSVAAGVFVALGSVVCALAVGAAIDPADTGAAVEAHGLVTLWLALLVVVLGLLQWVSEKLPPVALAGALGMRRTPWILCLVLVPLVASAMDTRVGYHGVTLEDDQPAAQQMALKKAVRTWYRAAEACRPKAGVVPMVLVASPGGGARAAYWTGQVMSRLQKRDACAGGSVFAGSGVSGGSVGLAVWSATAQSGVAGTEDALETLVGPDALSATVAAMLFRDLPRSFLALHPYDADRAAVEQDVWIDQVPELGDVFYASADDGGWRPKLILNSSDIATGCKVVVSQIDLHPGAGQPDDDEEAPTAQECTLPPDPDEAVPLSLEAGSVDAADFLHPADCASTEASNLSMAAASLLSARFPYVSPSGALTACDASGENGEEDAERLFAADGGYLENSGLHTLMGLWQDMEPIVEKVEKKGGPRVLPLAVLVDNHYRSEAALQPTGRVRELTGPATADRNALLGIEALEQGLAAEFGPALGGKGRGATSPRWFVIAPSTRPDVSAPLGWSLSAATRLELDCQLPTALQQGDDDDNRCAEGADEDDKENKKNKENKDDGARLVELLKGPKTS